MRLVVVSIGRLKQGPERELADRYRERFDDIGRKLGFRGLEIHEIPESRARDAASRIAEEAGAITAAIPEKRSEEHTSELQSHSDLVCRLLLEKKKKHNENGSNTTCNTKTD